MSDYFRNSFIRLGIVLVLQHILSAESYIEWSKYARTVLVISSALALVYPFNLQTL